MKYSWYSALVLLIAYVFLSCTKEKEIITNVEQQIELKSIAYQDSITIEWTGFSGEYIWQYNDSVNQDTHLFLVYMGPLPNNVVGDQFFQSPTVFLMYNDLHEVFHYIQEDGIRFEVFHFWNNPVYGFPKKFPIKITAIPIENG